ncbi:CERS5 isoform 15 [Pan troglodytes]|uniref:CERS5 isoform 11 n=3 Tax=Pan TaxID=9596 RepID=A0A2J8KE40_PANTR|nr:CERS5 isoform 11 [Pan troglodytes]PNI33285.1 CERS5 isoform 15 [Pan troglodytes]
MATAQGPLSLLWGWLWSERFWLPENVSWADLEGPADGYGYPRGRHILSVFPLAAGIFFVRLLFERFIAKPCALRIGIEDSGPYQAQPNAILEKVFISITKYPDKKRLEGLSKQLDWNVRKIQCWFRHRRNQDKPPTLTKFCESIHLGSGTSDSAGITIHFSLFQVGFITIISWNWPSIGPLCFLSLQTLKERTS